MNVMHRGVLVLLGACFALGACAAQRTAAVDPIGDVPDDFSIDLTVLVQPTDEDALTVRAAHLKQSRIVLLPDGSLHYGADPDRGADWLPGLTRRLSRQQIAHVWALLRQLGLTDVEQADPMVNFNLIEVRPGDVAYLAALTAESERWAFLRVSPISGEPDAAMVMLVRTLAQLAWATDIEQVDDDTPARRYDFGPDPYVRYR